MKKKLIAPSLLSADFANLQSEMIDVIAAGADWLHVDVMDGHFVPNLTIGVPVVESLKKVCSVPLDVHLMIENPDRYAEAFIKAGADILTVHVEALEAKKMHALLSDIRKWGAKAGITLRPGTAMEKVEPFLNEVDLFLVMTVEPGFGGQKFRMEQVKKITEARELSAQQNPNLLIEVDGGVNEQTAHHCVDADVLVAGSAVFNADNYKTAIATLRKKWSGI